MVVVVIKDGTLEKIFQVKCFEFLHKQRQNIQSATLVAMSVPQKNIYKLIGS